MAGQADRYVELQEGCRRLAEEYDRKERAQEMLSLIESLAK